MKDTTNKGLKDFGYFVLYLVLFSIVVGIAGLCCNLLSPITLIGGYVMMFWLATLGRYGEGHPKRDYLCMVGWFLVPILGPWRLFLACGTGMRRLHEKGSLPWTRLLKVWFSVVVVVFVLGLLGSCSSGFLRDLGHEMAETEATKQAENATATVVALTPTSTPVPTRTPVPTSTPTPMPSWWDESAKLPRDPGRSNMTELQFSAWLKGLVGNRYCFKGTINQVQADGDVSFTPSEGGVIDTMVYQSISLDKAMKLKKGDIMLVCCTVTDWLDFLGITLYCK